MLVHRGLLTPPRAELNVEPSWPPRHESCTLLTFSPRHRQGGKGGGGGGKEAPLIDTQELDEALD